MTHLTDQDQSRPPLTHELPLLEVAQRRRPKREPRLMFAPRAWLKLVWFLHAGETEVGGFGVSAAAADDPLYVEDFVTIRQRTTAVTVAFDDDAVADYYDARVDAGLVPAQFGRIWIHTHPGDSPQPSGTDEQTFARVFGPCEWAVMFIVSRTGRTYARLRFNAGPGGEMLVPMEVDWSAWPAQLDSSGESGAWARHWRAEFEANVLAQVTFPRHWQDHDAAQDAGWDVDLMLGDTWPWGGGGEAAHGHDLFDLEALHEQQTYEEDLVCGLELIEPSDAPDETGVMTRGH